MDGDGGYRSIVLYDLEGPTVVDQIGPPTRLAGTGAAGRRAALDDARSCPLRARSPSSTCSSRSARSGFATVDDPADPRYVVYAERTLSADPNVRRRTDEPFAHLEYALYLGAGGSRPTCSAPASATCRIDGRRATVTVAVRRPGAAGGDDADRAARRAPDRRPVVDRAARRHSGSALTVTVLLRTAPAAAGARPSPSPTRTPASTSSSATSPRRCSSACCRSGCGRRRARRSRPATGRPVRRASSAATSTTPSASTTSGGASSSATSAGRASRPPP